MHASIRSLLVATLSAVLISGCAVGNKHQYAESIPSIKTLGAKSIALGVLDKRLVVVNKTKTLDFVGVQRGGFGNPFDVTTASGKSLAAEMSASLATAMKDKGVQVKEVALEAGSDEIESIRKLGSAGMERSVLLLLNEWKSDTFQNTALHYDINLMLFDPEGKLLARQDQKGKDNLGGSFMNPPEHAKGAVPIAYRKKMEELFDKPEIGAALK